MKRKQLLLTSILITMITITSFAQIPLSVPSNGLVGWWGFNGNANDESGNLNNGTVTGSTLTTDRFGNLNTAYSFNGTSDYIDAPLTTPLNTQNITGLTISGWCRLNSLTSISSILSISDVANSELYGIKYDGSSSPFFNGANGVDGSAATTSINGLGSPVINNWYNVVLTCDYSTNISKLYINGILQNQSSVILNRPIITNVHIGAWVTFNGYWYADGKLDDIGIWNRTLTQQEISGMLDNCGITDITTGLVSSYSFNGNANDGSGNSNNGTVTGSTLTTDRFGNLNTAYSFNGTSDYIDAPLTTPLNTQNITGLTISGWCSLNSLTSINSILSISDVANSELYGIKYDGSSSPVFNGVNGVDGSAATTSINGLSSPVINTWYNVTLTCDYSTNISKLYINGILQSQSSVILNRPIITNVHIGAWVTFNGYWYADGKLDDLKIYSRALTPCDVDSLFNEPNIVTTTIKEQLNSSSINVFPNPSKDHITIDYGKYFSMGGYTIKITNSLGQTVFTTPINQQTSYISLSTWTGNGLYFVSTIDGQGNMVDIKKIVIQ